MAQIKRVLGFVQPYTLRLVLAVILMATAGACQGIVVLLVQPVFDRVLAPTSTDARVILFTLPWNHHPVYLQEFLPGSIHNVWTVVAISIVGVILLKAISEYFGALWINFVGLSAVRDMRNLLYSRLVQQSISFFKQNPTGRLMSAVSNDTDKIQFAVSEVAADLLRQIFTLISLLAVIFYIDWKLSLISMLLVPFVVFPSANIGKVIRRASRASQDKMADLNHLLQETFTGIGVVKAFVTEHLEVARFRGATQRLLKTNLRWVRAQAMTSPMMELLGAATIAGLLFYERNEILHHGKTAGAFASFLVGLISVYQPIKRLAGVHNIFQQASGASDQVFSFLDTRREMAEKPGAITLPPFSSDIAFDHVNFDYETGLPLLRDIGLTIRKGEVVALVGPSGAGKTTLASLIPRFYDPTRGSILVDGRDLRDLKLNSLRAQIGLVSQGTFLFNDTVFNNICYGSKPRRHEEVFEAARAALAHDFIMSLAQGYETVIGERGARLSGGQRQRLAIARALLKNAPILILDEATSELDTESEMLVQKALQNLMVGRTVLVIAHRLSTVRRADRIVVLDQGVISEVGTHNDLVNRGGIYQRLHELQFVDAEV